MGSSRSLKCYKLIKTQAQTNTQKPELQHITQTYGFQHHFQNNKD